MAIYTTYILLREPGNSIDTWQIWSIYGYYIFTYIYNHKNEPNVGKDNTIHGLYEENNSECWLPSSFDMDNLMILIYQEGHITRHLVLSSCRVPNADVHPTTATWSCLVTLDQPSMGRNTKPATTRRAEWHGGSPRETRKLNPLTEASWDLRDLKSSHWMNDAEWKKIFLRTPKETNR